MKFNFNHFKIYKDMFNLHHLITKINPDYKLYFNEKDKTYAIVNSAKNNEICLNFNSFSLNLIKVLQETGSINSKQIFESIETHNQNLMDKNQEKAKLELSSKLLETKNILDRCNSISSKEINKIIGGNNA